MSKLYEKLAAERDKSNPTSQTRAFESTIYTQLLSAAFCNVLHPDELPPHFYIRNIAYDKNNVEAILEKVGINAEVKHLYSDFARGNTFAITLKESN